LLKTKDSPFQKYFSGFLISIGQLNAIETRLRITGKIFLSVQFDQIGQVEQQTGLFERIYCDFLRYVIVLWS